MISDTMTMTMPFDVCERFIDRLLGMFPNITREQAKQYVASIDEVITVTETKVEERIISVIEQKLQPKIKLEIKESDIVTGKDILILDHKIDSLEHKMEKNILVLVNKIDSVICSISTIKWLFGIMITISSVLLTFLSWKIK